MRFMIGIDVIREHCEENVRLVASLETGHLAPSTMLRKLAAPRGRTRLTPRFRKSAKLSEHCSCSTGLKAHHSGDSSARPEQERAAPRPHARKMHIPAGPYHRSQPRGPATPRLPTQPGHRRDRLLEFHLYSRRRDPSVIKVDVSFGRLINSEGRGPGVAASLKSKNKLATLRRIAHGCQRPGVGRRYNGGRAATGLQRSATNIR